MASPLTRASAAPAATETVAPSAAPAAAEAPAVAEPAAEPAGPAACLLRIIHVNDVYQLKNFPKLKTLIAEQSAGCANVIVTLAGDFIAPSLLSALRTSF